MSCECEWNYHNKCIHPLLKRLDGFKCPKVRIIRRIKGEKVNARGTK
jgi:hypothetical protein